MGAGAQAQTRPTTMTNPWVPAEVTTDRAPFCPRVLAAG